MINIPQRWKIVIDQGSWGGPTIFWAQLKRFEVYELFGFGGIS